MPEVFVFGTLCHPPLLDIVLGRSARVVPAFLADHAACLDGQGRPPQTALCASPGARADGLIVTDATPQDFARLEYYLGGYSDGIRQMQVRGLDGTPHKVLVALKSVAPRADAPAFVLAPWVARWGPLACGTAHEIMARFGVADMAETAALRPFLAARAWAQELARRGAPHTLRSDRGRDTVELVRDRPGFEGFFRLRAFDLRHRRFDGTMSDTFGRESFVTYDAALVLPYDPETDRVLLVEQLRYGTYMRGDPFPSVLEPPAGLVDAGETPEACALREAREEAGLTLRALHPMLRAYASPGYTTEFYHCFLGLCSLSEADNGLAGLEEENEDIRNHVISFDHAMTLVDSGEINVAPLAAMLLWLARHRDRIRAES
ncbi:tellurite resistance protein TrgB [Citreicella sp. 357]|nr:tellurite resistance protein TrgB [Citreicella sp. 357]